MAGTLKYTIFKDKGNTVLKAANALGTTTPRTTKRRTDRYDRGDVWENPDNIVAQKEHKAFHNPKIFGGC